MPILVVPEQGTFGERIPSQVYALCLMLESIFMRYKHMCLLFQNKLLGSRLIAGKPIRSLGLELPGKYGSCR